ncbi:MAG: hypothetical protein DI603_03640 [Roseateles depolymerans]|uniref:PEP-CTERM protein-sorting domain-containing protein n=1 Tax=Roseateles depolymerans TaxID=76731 RepID=A0A2W5DZ31_9BURK|nr:MAG: hypothetical protein DI603_03640 [Roseateles depolymerans]
MRVTSTLLALTLAAALQPALADTVSLKFEDLTQVTALTDQYASSGISFSGDVWGTVSRLNGCGGTEAWTRSDAVSCGAIEVGKNIQDLPGSDTASFTINVANGFIEAFSFVFASRATPNVSIMIWDGLNGTGNQLLAQPVSLSGDVCTSVYFCGPWTSSSLAFAGIAHSITVSAGDQLFAMDDLSFITPAASNALPEPGSVGLAAGALGALAWVRRRKTR